MKDLPFTLYEMTAILLPGFVLVISCLLLFVGSTAIDEKSFLHSLYLIAGSYVVGQINAEFALWLFEENLVKRFIGKPVDIVFGRANPGCVKHFFFTRYFLPQDSQVSKAVEALATKSGVTNLESWLYGQVTAKAKKEEVAQRLAEWSRLFGFSRNLSLAALLMTGVFLHLGFKTADHALSYWAIGTFGISVAMFYRYIRFYRVYTVELCGWLADSKL